jgi:hypothetical protein
MIDTAYKYYKERTRTGWKKVGHHWDLHVLLNWLKPKNMHNVFAESSVGYYFLVSGTNERNFRCCRTPMVFKIKQQKQKQKNMRSTTVQISSRLLYFYTTRNKFGVQPPSEYMCCHLEWSQWTNPSRDFFGSFSRESRSVAFCVRPSWDLKFCKSLGIMLIWGTATLLPSSFTSAHLYTHQYR